MTPVSLFQVPAILIGALIAVSCNSARNVVVVDVSFKDAGYEEKELIVTGRPIFIKNGFEPSLQIEGFYKPNGERCAIHSPLADEVFERKLDPQKTYRFRLYTAHQKSPVEYYHAMLSKVEEAGSTVIDASVCDVHGCGMEFGHADQAEWRLKSPKEERDLEVHHNHGYDFPSCCSGGLIRWDVWVCPKCRKKVDAFKSKYIP
jgi:hypothetical protein